LVSSLLKISSIFINVCPSDYQDNFSMLKLMAIQSSHVFPPIANLS